MSPANYENSLRHIAVDNKTFCLHFYIQKTLKKQCWSALNRLEGKGSGHVFALPSLSYQIVFIFSKF